MIKVRFEHIGVCGEGINRLRVRQGGKKKNGHKAKGDMFARAKQEYAFKKPDGLVPIPGSHWGKYGQVLKDDGYFEYTENVRPVKLLGKVVKVAPAVDVQFYNKVNRLLTAALLFKGKTFTDVKHDLIIAKERGKKHITYAVNTKVIFGHPDVNFTIGHVTVKKTFDDGIFFDSHSCKGISVKLLRLPQQAEVFKAIEQIDF